MKTTFDQFCTQYCAPAASPVAFDYSRSGMTASFLEKMEPLAQKAFADMDALEKGAIANPDENRMVGHYWLRNPDLIPCDEVRAEFIEDSALLKKLITAIHNGSMQAANGKPFTKVLSIGIGGSALGPQLVADALGKDAGNKMEIFFLDNTDPQGISRVLAQLDGQLDQTLSLVISKSGGTPETRNGMLLAEEAYKAAGLDFGQHAIAITGKSSKLDQYAKENGWIDRLPMYDWVGGRTSVMASVGLLPVGLQGVDIDAFLEGAKQMDDVTRVAETTQNPAMLLALFWHFATNGKGEKDMVVLPYKDRLQLYSRYLQQLVMESIGKEHDLDGKVVDQGVTVYGNKGSTDQHAYVQQLRDGVNNFFVIFLEVLKDGGNDLFEVEPGVTAGDYLSGLYQGTRTALTDKDRLNATITVEEVTPQTLGALIGLFERAVGFYASLVNINAYHQPGVEAGKKAAGTVLETQLNLVEAIKNDPTKVGTAADWAEVVGCEGDQAFKILQHLAYNNRGIKMTGRTPAEATFQGC